MHANRYISRIWIMIKQEIHELQILSRTRPFVQTYNVEDVTEIYVLQYVNSSCFFVPLTSEIEKLVLSSWNSII